MKGQEREQKKRQGEEEQKKEERSMKYLACRSLAPPLLWHPIKKYKSKVSLPVGMHESKPA